MTGKQATLPGEMTSPLVVTGSSAGGIEALSALVASLPPDFGAPIVVAQHLDPSKRSRLDEVLASRSTLPIRLVNDKELLVAGTVYLVPADRDAEVLDGHVRVGVRDRDRDRHSQPSVDLLLESAARAYGELLIADILSGTGSDGVAGARAVKARGGTVVIQDPSTAAHPGMPQSLAPTDVDVIARIEDVAKILSDLIGERMLSPESQNDDALQAFLDEVRERSGIDFRHYKASTIKRRLARLMAAARTPTLEAYARTLRRNPENYQRLISAFLIKVTEFFRDAALFEYFRTALLPDLIDAARRHGDELRIWSAGCATGEEAYTLALIVAELLEERPDLPVRIFATDLDGEAIAHARRGIYPAEALADVPHEMIERYFIRSDDTFEVGTRIRNMTVFGQHDLGQQAPFPRIDLVLCRNVLIYFTKELQHRVLQAFAFAVRDGGYLALGKAETTVPLPQHFREIEASLHVHRREGERALPPPSRRGEHSPAANARRKTAVRVAAAAEASAESRGIAELAWSLTLGSALGLVLVDRRYDVLAINRAARALLNIHGVAIGEDFVHLARNADASVLREAIDSALRNAPVEFARELTVRSPSNETERVVAIATYAAGAGPSLRSERALVMLVDVTAAALAQRASKHESAEQRAEIEALRARTDELLNRQRGLLEANDELTAANADLRAENEGLLLDAEQLASTSEEVETLNEEMQSSNEELEMLNEELQATIEELNATNDELEARGAELAQAGAARERNLAATENERDLIRVLLDRLDAPLAILSDDSEVLAQSSRFKRMRSSLQLRVDGRPLAFERLVAAAREHGAELQFEAQWSADGTRYAGSGTIATLPRKGEANWIVRLAEDVAR